MTTVDGLNNQYISVKSKLGDLKPISAETVAQLEDFRRMAELPAERGTAANDPSKLWGEIKKNGETIARIYKGGVAEISDKYAMTFSSDGPAERAAEFLKRFGGSLYLSGPSKDLFSL